MDLETLCIIEPLSCWALTGSFQAADQFPIERVCDSAFLGMCLVATASQGGGIFGFAEFVQAFALLVLIYTLSEIRYRFRVATAPVPLWSYTFWLAGLIGVGSLVTDLWFVQQYPLPTFLANRAYWQTLFGALFLILVFTWIWYAFFRPPTFGKLNAKNFTRAMYSYLMQGAETDLPVIASELEHSAHAIVRYATERQARNIRGQREVRRRLRPVERCANDTLLLIGNRKFCRHIVASAPGTAVAFFSAMSELKKYHIPIGQFAANVSTEALINRDSILYHEDEGYYSGFFGYVRPFTTALYGDFHLVEALTRGNSPLDIDFEVQLKFNGKQLGAYSRAVLATFASALEEGQFYAHSFALYRAFEVIEGSVSGLSKLDNEPSASDIEDVLGRLRAAVRFINDAIDILETHGIKHTSLRRHDEAYKWRDDYYDHLAHLMFEIISCASSVKTKEFLGWSVQHNMVWREFFSHFESKTRSIVLFKLRRLLYEEILTLETMPNFQNGAILGFCLNVMGLRVGSKRDHTRYEYQLRKAVISWARRKYLWLRKSQPKAAEAVLLGTISFDARKGQLVKTYDKGLRLKAPTERLDLDEPVGKIERFE